MLNETNSRLFAVRSRGRFTVTPHISGRSFRSRISSRKTSTRFIAAASGYEYSDWNNSQCVFRRPRSFGKQLLKTMYALRASNYRENYLVFTQLARMNLASFVPS